MNEPKQEERRAASGCLGLTVLTIIAIGCAYAMVYIAEWLMGV